jgi:predicted phosphoribosyltransferase
MHLGEEDGRFRDRVDAGQQLAERLRAYGVERPLVLGIARGGVVVAAEVARALGAPLHVMVARKLGAPGRPELGIGAVAPGVRVIDHEAVRALGVSPGELEHIAVAETAEMQRRLREYRGTWPEPDVRDRTVILIDDGLATGVTAQAAIRSLRRQQPRRLVLATPVCSAPTALALRVEADLIVCLVAPAGFTAVGEGYADFTQATDAEVRRLLERDPVTWPAAGEATA